jgi:hypothetical protein
MSTHVTVAVAKPNHLPVRVYAEVKHGAQWVPAVPASEYVPLGGADTFLVDGSRRIIVEEAAA